MSAKNLLISSLKLVYYETYEKIRLSYERSIAKVAQNNPLVFVYIPTYNRADVLIDRAVKSALRQTYTNLKILVVGDGCTDDTGKRLAKITDSRLDFINLPRLRRYWPDEPKYHWLMGATIPSNYALSCVEGDYIARVDDDDVWLPEHIEASLSYLQKYNFEFISSHQKYYLPDGYKVDAGLQALDSYYTRKKSNSKKNSPRLGGMSSIFYVSYLSFLKYNKDSWRKNWNKNNDIDFMLRMYRCGARMGFIDKVLSESYPRPGRNSIGSAAISERKSGEIY